MVPLLASRPIVALTMLPLSLLIFAEPERRIMLCPAERTISLPALTSSTTIPVEGETGSSEFPLRVSSRALTTLSTAGMKVPSI